MNLYWNTLTKQEGLGRIYVGFCPANVGEASKKYEI
jgi:hypothetical protein